MANVPVFRICNPSNNNFTPASPDYNETMSFGGGLKSYMDVIYNSSLRYILGLSDKDIDELTNDSEASRFASTNKKILSNKKKGKFKPPRPYNSWIIYRRYIERIIKAGGPLPDGSSLPDTSSLSDVSKKIGKMWKSEKEEVIEYFNALSMFARDKHKKKYPDYKYEPRNKRLDKPKNQSKQKRTKSNQHSPETSSYPTPSTISSPPNEYQTPSTISSSPSTTYSSVEDFPIFVMNADIYDNIDDIIQTSETSEMPQEYPTPYSPENSALMMNDNIMNQAYPDLTDITTNESPLSTLGGPFETFMRDASNLAVYTSQPETITIDAKSPLLTLFETFIRVYASQPETITMNALLTLFETFITSQPETITMDALLTLFETFTSQPETDAITMDAAVTMDTNTIGAANFDTYEDQLTTNQLFQDPAQNTMTYQDFTLYDYQDQMDFSQGHNDCNVSNVSNSWPSLQ